MSFTLTDIEDALISILRDVDGIGKIHTRERWTNEQLKLKEWFKAPDKELINGTCIIRPEFGQDPRLSRLLLDRHAMTIWSVYSYNEAKDTYHPFQYMIEAQVRAINVYYGGYPTPGAPTAWHKFADEGWARMAVNEVRDWTGIFVHYAEVRVILEVRG